MTSRLALWKPVLVAAVLLAALATILSVSTSGAATASAKKCKKGQVRVKLNGKTRCKPLRSALPKPRAGDRTLIDLRLVLGVDRSELRTRRGKRPRPLPRRVAVAMKKGRRITLRALPKLMRMLNRLEQRAGTSKRRRARAGAVRCGGPGSTVASDTGRTAGAGLEARVGPNGEEGGVITAPVNGMVVETTFVRCGTRFYYVSGCPKSNGDASTSGRGRMTTTTRVLNDGRLVSSQSSDQTWEDRLLGKVMDDAKLKYFDFTRKEENLIVASGGVVLRGTANRTVRVNMPSGSYDAAQSRVVMSGDTSMFRGDDLAASIQEAIAEYKAAQDGGSFLHTDGWATFDRKRDPFCAKATFSPASNAITLNRSQTGRLSMYAKGSDGGRATGARWMLEGPLNATFNPSSSRDPSPSINYTVSATPSGNRVNLTVRFTSTAGVGKDTWTEPIKNLPAVNRIQGTFSGQYRVPTILGDSVLTWTGNVVFGRVTPAILGGASGSYNVVSGSYTVTASGIDGSTATGCQQTGTKAFDLGPSSGFIDVLSLAPDFSSAPFTYSMHAVKAGPHTMDITRVNCPEAAKEDWEGTTGNSTFVAPGLNVEFGTAQSPDGLVYQGSSSNTTSGVTYTQSWSLQGTE